MLRTQLLSAATAALLALGMSVAGAGAAVAVDEPREPAVGEVTAEPMPFLDDIAPEALDEAPIITDVNPQPVPSPDCVVVIWQMPGWADQWNPTWPQSFVSMHVSDCAATTIDAALFPVPDACGTQYQLDKYYASEKTTALIAGGVLQGYGPEEDLVPGLWGTLVKNPDCITETVEVAAAVTPFACDSVHGSFMAGLVDPSGDHADLLLWTTTAGTVPSATANTVSEPGVVTVTVRLANAHLGDAVVDETSDLGVVSTITVDGIETALITWTFSFSAPIDCELEAVVVPLATEADACEGSGSNAVQVASFTVTAAENISYRYTVNGGSPIDIVFAEGETDATVTVAPLDAVVVVAHASTGFELPEDYLPWSHDFLASAFCPGTFPATVAAAEITPVDCVREPVTVTLTNESGVIWTLNGSVVAGNATHELVAGSSVRLTSALEGPTGENEGGWTWSDPQQQTVWTQERASDDVCLASLESLVNTGAAPATGWLAAAAILTMIVGMGAVTGRRAAEA